RNPRNRLRNRHRGAGSGGRIRRVSPGRPRLHQQAGRHRPRSCADPEVRRAAQRPDLARQQTRQRLDFYFHDSHDAMSLILIVEDNEKNLKLVRDVLQVKGFSTLEAGTAEDGIKLARESKPDLILMDIHLPGMSGIEALKVLRGEPGTAAIPVIAVTASVMQQDRKQITEAGFDAYVGKPINLKEFLDAVRAALERKEAAK